MTGRSSFPRVLTPGSARLTIRYSMWVNVDLMKRHHMGLGLVSWGLNVLSFISNLYFTHGGHLTPPASYRMVPVSRVKLNMVNAPLRADARVWCHGQRSFNRRRRRFNLELLR